MRKNGRKKLQKNGCKEENVSQQNFSDLKRPKSEKREASKFNAKFPR